jgi:hypothetical protein
VLCHYDNLIFTLCIPGKEKHYIFKQKLARIHNNSGKLDYSDVPLPWQD